MSMKELKNDLVPLTHVYGNKERHAYGEGTCWTGGENADFLRCLGAICGDDWNHHRSRKEGRGAVSDWSGSRVIRLGRQAI